MNACILLSLLFSVTSAIIAAEEVQEGYFEPDSTFTPPSDEVLQKNLEEMYKENAAAFTQFEAIEAEAITLPKDEADEIPLITPEESAQRIALLEKEKIKKQHEALVAEANKTKEAQERENLFAYNLKGLKEAGVDITKQGFALTAKYSMFADQYVRLTAEVHPTEIRAQGYMNEINLCNLLKISGYGPDKKQGTPDDGVYVELKLTPKEQRFAANGVVELLKNTGEASLIMGIDLISFILKINLLSIFKTIFIADFKPLDTDMLLAAALEADFVQYLQKLGEDALSQLGKFISDGSEKAQDGINDALAKVKTLEKDRDAAVAALKKVQDKYDNAKNTMQRPIEDILSSIKSQQEACRKELRKILDAREKVLAGRKKISSAQDKVNGLRSEVDHAKRRLRSASSSASWKRPWMYAVVAYWATRLAAVEAARNVAIGVLSAAKYAIYPVAELLSATYHASYAGAKAGLAAEYGALYSAKMAAYPLAAPLYGAVIDEAIKLAGIEIALRAAQGALYTAYGTMEASKQVGKGVDLVGKYAGKAIGGLFMVEGGGIKCQLSRLIRGSIDLYLVAHLFGARKNLNLSLDVAHPEKFASSFAKMLVDLVNPTSSSNASIFDEISAAREKFSGELARIAEEKMVHEEKLEGLKKQQAERAALVEKLNNEYKQNLAAINQEFSFSEEELKELVDLDVVKEQMRISTVDEKNPTSYIAANMQNTFRWLDKWQLVRPDEGTILFDVVAESDVEIAFHTTRQDYERIENAHLVEAEQDQEDKVLADLEKEAGKKTTVSDVPYHYGIFIGADNNTRSFISSSDGILLASTREHEALLASGSKPQPFWISYNHGHIICGKGKTPGQNIILEWHDEAAPTGITYFSFSCKEKKTSYNGITTAPAITKPFGSVYALENKYHQFWWHSQFTFPEENGGTVYFKAKATDALAIGATDDAGSPVAKYIAIIGAENNALSILGKSTEDKKSYTYHSVTKDPDALLPTERADVYRDYWLTVDGKHCALGTGTDATANSILEFHDDAQSTIPTFFSFSAWEQPIVIKDVRVTAPVSFTPGSKFSAIDKKGAMTWNSLWRLAEAGAGTITWRAKGEESMIVALGVAPDATTKPSVTCVIGAESNSKTSITDAAGTVLATSQDPAARIQEKSRYNNYWLTYDHGYIALGSNTEPGLYPVIECSTDDLPLTHFCFSNQNGYIEYQDITALPVTTTARFTTATIPPTGTPVWNDLWAPRTPFAPWTMLCLADGNGPLTVQIKTNNGSELAPVEIARTTKGFYPFWCTYSPQNSTLSYGSGPLTSEPMHEVVLNKQQVPTALGFANTTKQPLTLKHITIAPQGSPVFAEVASLLATTVTTELASPTSYQWNNAQRLSSPDAALLTFAVKADHTVMWALGKENKAIYEVTIGGNNNTETLLSKNGIVCAKTTNPQACLARTGNYEKGWINYYKGHLTCGWGNPGEIVALEWTDPVPEKNLTHYALASQSKTLLYKDVASSPGIKIPYATTWSAFETQNTFEWKNEWNVPEPEKGIISFTLASEHGGSIGFTTANKKEPVYRVHIDKDITLFKYDKELIREKNPLTLSYETPSTYWISYHQGTLSVGTGKTPSQETEIAQYHDAFVFDVITRFSFASPFKHADFSSITTNTITTDQQDGAPTSKTPSSFVARSLHKTYTFIPEWTLVEGNRGTITFTAQGGASYRIGLSNEPGYTTKAPLYEVVIGAKGNTQLEIRSHGVARETLTTPEATVLIESEPTQYWVSVNGGTISVGSGEPGMRTLARWKDINPPDSAKPLYFSFSSDTSTVTYRSIASTQYVKPRRETEFIAVSRNGSYKFDNEWKLQKPNESGLTLSIRGEKDAMIGLRSAASPLPLCEVIIGADNNTKTIIRSKGKVVAEASGSDARLANKYLAHPYWINVTGASVIVGKGHVIGENTILAWTDTSGPPAEPYTHFVYSSGDTTVRFSGMESTQPMPWSLNRYYRAQNRNDACEFLEEWRFKEKVMATFLATAPRGGIVLCLAATPYQPLYTIVLGGWQNTQSAILKDGKIVAINKDPIKRDPKKKYWIGYADNRIMVGKGDPQSDKAILLDWTDPHPQASAQYLSFSSRDTVVTYENIALQR